MKMIKKNYWFTFKKKPNEAFLQKFYANKYFVEDKNFNYKLEDWEKKYNHLMSLMRVKIIEMNSTSKIKNKTLLDVGCGKGDFLKAASNKFKNTCGVDFSKKQINNSIKKKCTIISENPNSFLKKKNKFDFICLTNILEHSIDPDKILKYLKNNTKKNAMFLITIPNDFSELQKKTFKIVKKKYWLTYPEHLNYIDKKNFLKTINKNFKIVDAFADFPVELFLLTKKINYIKNKNFGKDVHEFRCESINTIYDINGKDGLMKLLKYFYNTNIGRNNTFLLKKN